MLGVVESLCVGLILLLNPVAAVCGKEHSDTDLGVRTQGGEQGFPAPQ